MSSRNLLLLVVAVFILAWIALSIWTFRRLWRSWNTPYEQMVYRFGVRFVGMGSWPVFTVVIALLQRDESMSPALSATIMLFIGFPICLWTGYWWGRTMAMFYGLSDDRAA